ncbi:MAG: MoaD family protein [Candidatus Bathyarchaeota archaeon]|nr:MAG: MoaD family protein [Candidatus Bathyarchaeota archaeon]
MIQVEVSFFANVRVLTEEPRATINLPEKSSILDLMHSLKNRYSEAFGGYIFAERGRLQQYVVVILNGRGIAILDGLETPLNDGDLVSVMPAVGGG